MNENVLIYFSLFTSILTLAYTIYYFQLRKKNVRKIDQKKAEIYGQRERLENQIYELEQILLSNPDRLFDNTKLLLEFNDKDLTISNTVPNNSFYNSLGIDFKDISIKDKSVFCLMPFHKSFNKTYETIFQACDDSDYICYRSDTPYNPGKLLPQIVKLIIESQLIVAVLDGKNPNVFYEIGLAHSIGKTVILIANLSNINDIPFDLKSDRLLLYSNQNDLRKKLVDALKNIHYVK